MDQQMSDAFVKINDIASNLLSNMDDKQKVQEGLELIASISRYQHEVSSKQDNT